MNPSKSLLFVVATGSLLAIACATVPKDAPKELRDAETELQRSKDLGSKTHFPKTVAQAEQELNKSVELYRESQGTPPKEESFSETWDEWAGGKPTRSSNQPRVVARTSQDAFQQSLAHAKRSKDLAKSANQLSVNMKGWDENVDALKGNYSIPKLMTQVTELKEELGRAHAEIAATNRYEPTEMEPVTESPFARLTDFRVATPVAYFSVGSAEVKDEYRSGIEELAQSVRLHPEFRLAVVGYADTQGPEQVNDEIAKRRAESVAALLENEGIDRERISVEGMGSPGTATNSIGKRQLERRVVVMLSVAPTE